MPDGFSKVSDLKIVISAATGPLQDGLKDAQGLIKSFSTDGSSGLGMIDAVLGKVGGSVLSVAGRFNTLAIGLETGVALYQQFAKEGRAVAEALGVTAEFDRLKATVDELGVSLMDAGVLGFEAIKSVGVDAASTMFGFADATSVGDANAKSFAATLLDKVTEALDSTRLKLRLLNAEMSGSPSELGTTLTLLNAQIERTQERLRAIQSGEIKPSSTIFARSAENMRLDTERELNDLLSQRSRLLNMNRAAQEDVAKWQVITETSAEQLLRSEAEALEEKNRRLGGRGFGKVHGGTKGIARTRRERNRDDARNSAGPR